MYMPYNISQLHTTDDLSSASFENDTIYLPKRTLEQQIVTSTVYSLLRNHGHLNKTDNVAEEDTSTLSNISTLNPTDHLQEKAQRHQKFISVINSLLKKHGHNLTPFTPH